MQRLIALTDNNSLISIDTTDLSQSTSTSITGLDSTLLGIDVRPADGLLYGLTTANSLYTIDASSGAATLVSTLSVPFEGGVVSGFDFNPVADRLRLVGDNDQNFRINVDTGDVTVDGTLAFGDGDANTSVNPNVTAAAYTNSFAGTTSTALYDIDPLLDSLLLQSPPNDGTLVTVGDLGIDFDIVGGFDIFSTPDGQNSAFAASDGMLYAINLGTGAATSLGTLDLGNSGNLLGLAAIDTAPLAPDFLALTSSNTLLGFTAANPDKVSSLEVTGLEGTLLGIDVRPADGLLYGLTTANSLYTIDTSSGAATLVSTLSIPFGGGVVSGFDFNPVADRLRLVGDNDQNFRINVDTGDVTVDGTLAFGDGDANARVNPNITAAAYTNSFAGTTSTALYDIDPLLDSLLLQSPPNDGTLVTVGDLGIDFDIVGGFDIFSTPDGQNSAFAASDGMLYAINLGTGAATSLGTFSAETDDLLGFVALSNPLGGALGDDPKAGYTAAGSGDDLLNSVGLDLGAIAADLPGGQALLSGLGDLLMTLEIPSLNADSLAALGITVPEGVALDALLPQADINSVIGGLQAEIAAALSV
ncbi:DUF4394 domain-containing protein [Nodosilinea nodulosa]|uniref:DUF4394 domain-containing protein n=1 Tax=Nodosilinea nodulosa TaxID=416001 RepID=UPI0003190DF2|nr:DUF4394 domain-containing protein [Nodosilinea nodulosa]